MKGIVEGAAPPAVGVFPLGFPTVVVVMLAAGPAFPPVVMLSLDFPEGALVLFVAGACVALAPGTWTLTEESPSVSALIVTAAGVLGLVDGDGRGFGGRRWWWFQVRDFDDFVQRGSRRVGDRERNLQEGIPRRRFQRKQKTNLRFLVPDIQQMHVTNEMELSKLEIFLGRFNRLQSICCSVYPGAQFILEGLHFAAAGFSIR